MAELQVDELELQKISYTGDLRFTSAEIAPSVLGDVLSAKYNQTWLEWEGATLWQTITSDFQTEIHPVVKEKIQAVKLLMLTDDFWKAWDVFAVVVKAFNSLIPNFTMAEECSPGEMAWAVEEANSIRQEPFSDEVILYVRAMCQTQGLIIFPEQLSFAQIVVSEADKAIQLAWESASRQLTFVAQEDEVGIQLARLNSIRHYIKAMAGESEKIVLKYEKRW